MECANPSWYNLQERCKISPNQRKLNAARSLFNLPHPTASFQIKLSWCSVRGHHMSQQGTCSVAESLFFKNILIHLTEI